MTSPNTILLKGQVIQREGLAGGAVNPGHLVKLNSSSQVVVQATAGGIVPKLFALEKEYLGKEITSAYASGDQVVYAAAHAGCEVYARLAASAAAIVVGDLLEASSDGTLRKLSVGDIADIAGTLTGSVDGTMEDVTALSTSNTYTDAAVNAKITLVNLELKELQSKINAMLPVSNENPIAMALEAVDNSGGGSEAFIRVLVL